MIASGGTAHFPNNAPFVSIFAAFFAGAFFTPFVAFLVAICLFSLFDGLHRCLQ